MAVVVVDRTVKTADSRQNSRQRGWLLMPLTEAEVPAFDFVELTVKTVDRQRQLVLITHRQNRGQTEAVDADYTSSKQWTDRGS